jgi:hypothetical protein
MLLKGSNSNLKEVFIMNREKKAWIGILSLVGLLAPVSNSANALESTTENNLLSKTVKSEPADPKSAFLVSKPKSATILAKYENAVKLTDYDLVQLLKAVGFKGKGLRTAWAVAKAESNGRPFAFNGNAKTGDSSYGVFQINMIGDLGPDRRDKFDLGVNAELFSPVTNAEIVFHMTKGGDDWSAWKHAKPIQYQRWLKKFPTKYA